MNKSDRITSFLSLLIIIVVIVSCVSHAQEKDPRNQLSLWVLDSVGSNGLFSSSARGTVKQAEIRYGRYLYDEYGVTAHYIADFVPYAHYTYQNGGQASGFGASPLGAEVEFTHLYVRPMLTASGGFFYTDKSLFGGTGFNFTAQFGGGARILLNDTFAIDANYLVYHTSNWGLGHNPGMTNHAVAVGLTRRW